MHKYLYANSKNSKPRKARNLLHFFLALREGVSPVKLGLSKEENTAYIQCPDCGPPYIDGGTVVFKITKK